MRTSWNALAALIAALALGAAASESPAAPGAPARSVAVAPTADEPADQATASAGRAQLERQLEEAIAAAEWDPERWSVLVVSLEAGDTIFSHRPDEPVKPASNLKLFTTAAGLHYLGSDYRYSTYLTGTGPIRDGVLEGDLYVYGTGDPTISNRFFDSKLTVWEALADSLAALGVRRVAGDLVGDASYFEGPGVGQGWEDTYITHTYAAPASALSFNDNVVTVRVTAAEEAGSPARIQFVPGGEVELRNETRTTTSGRSHVEVVRESYDAPIVLRGTIRQGSSALWRAIPLRDPAHYAVSVLAEVLEDRDIRVDGRIRSLDEPSSSPITGQKVFAPATDEDPLIQVLAVHQSPPLQEILTVINQRSHNQYADAVLRTVGRVVTGIGSAEGGEAAVLALLEEAGPAGAVVRMDDGSGLSSSDQASARALVEILAFMAESPYADSFEATLPEAATDRGLRRMSQTPAAGNLRAKTGTIERVSALSGYVRAENGERLAFAILANDVPSTWTAKRVEDRIGARLASFDRPIPAPDADRRHAAATDPAAAAATDSPRALARGDEEREPATDRAGGEAADTPEESATEGTREGAGTRYVIKRGDTMDAIARKNGVPVTAIREANPGIDPRRLMPGQSITIPATGGNGRSGGSGG